MTPFATPQPVTLFRGHRLPAGAPLPSWDGVFGDLALEWVRLCAQPSTRRTFTRWCRTEPVLAAGGASCPGELLDELDATTRDRVDEVLLALLRLFQDATPLAGRVVLQVVLPDLARLSRHRSLAIVDTEERNQLLVATAWEVMAGYPLARRPAKVVDNVFLDTRKRVWAERLADSAELPVDPVGGVLLEEQGVGLDDGTAGLAVVEEAGSSALATDSDLYEVIAWGLDVEAIGPADAAALSAFYLRPRGVSGEAAAAELGTSYAALRQRCTRARARLIEAVTAHVRAATHLEAVGA